MAYRPKEWDAAPHVAVPDAPGVGVGDAAQHVDGPTPASLLTDTVADLHAQVVVAELVDGADRRRSNT